MHCLSLSLDSLLANVALDDALLEAAEAGELPGPLLRLWEADDYGVVLGRGGDRTRELRTEDLPATHGKPPGNPRPTGASLPVVRRPSGGGTVVVGPGCLMYAVLLPRSGPPRIDRVHEAVLQQTATAVQRALGSRPLRVVRAGTSDLAIVDAVGGPLRKVSGNSLRLKRRFLLYHGTLLYDFDLPLVEQVLAHPPREPDYREGRSHARFVANLPCDGAALRAALVASWQANQVLEHWPQKRLADLLAAPLRYAAD
jgi:lipoate-protein ligase A